MTFETYVLSLSPSSRGLDRKSTRLNSSHEWISYAVFCLKKKKTLIVLDSWRRRIGPELDVGGVGTDGPLLVDNIVVFFFNDTATTEIYTLSLHDALPIYAAGRLKRRTRSRCFRSRSALAPTSRSEEHTSALQSRVDLVCRLLLEQKKDIPRRTLSRRRKIQQSTNPTSIC